MGYHNQHKNYGFSAAKPREAQIISENGQNSGNNGQNGKRKVVIAITILSIIVLAIALFFAIKTGLFSGLKDVKIFSDKNEPELNNSEIVNIDLSSNSDSNSVNNSALVSDYTNNLDTVRLAILADPDLFDYKNQPVISCDAVVFAKTEISKTPKILNATLNLLFNDDFDYGFTPANFISTQKDLNFDSAVIENGIAKVYLSGKVGPLAGSCDNTRIQTQITETAKQFGSVKSVEIFLNGEKFEI